MNIKEYWKLVNNIGSLKQLAIVDGMLDADYKSGKLTADEWDELKQAVSATSILLYNDKARNNYKSNRY